MKRYRIGSFLLAACLSMPAAARAHGTGEMFLASTADGGGDLALEFEFDAVVRLGFSAQIGPVSLYTDIIPAIEPLTTDDLPNSLYALDSGTQVVAEIVAIDEGKASMKIGATTMNQIGDTAVVGTMPFGHTHPQYSLQLELPEGEFGEARISFKLTSTGPTSYGESEIYTLKLSNGPLPVPDYDASAYDSASVKCLSTAAQEARKYASKRQTYLTKCLDKAQVLAAKTALTSPPANLASFEAAAEKACADAAGTSPDSTTLLGKIEAARALSAAKIDAACGAGGSADMSADDIRQFLGLAACRADEVLGGVYGVGHEQIEDFTARVSQGGQPLNTYFPCLFLTATE